MEREPMVTEDDFLKKTKLFETSSKLTIINRNMLRININIKRIDTCCSYHFEFVVVNKLLVKSNLYIRHKDKITEMIKLDKSNCFEFDSKKFHTCKYSEPETLYLVFLHELKNLLQKNRHLIDTFFKK